MKSSHSCPTGKIRYPTDIEAREELERIKANPLYNVARHEKNLYYCKYCFGYHLTSNEFKRATQPFLKTRRKIPNLNQKKLF